MFKWLIRCFLKELVEELPSKDGSLVGLQLTSDKKLTALVSVNQLIAKINKYLKEGDKEGKKDS